MGKNNTVPFFKMTGGGNDFVVMDNRDESLPKDYSALAAQLCDRKFSIGADGLLVLEKNEESDFRMIYYNQDGSRAAMCGNGGRCIARFAHIQKAAQSKMKFMTDAGLVTAEVEKDYVRLGMSVPKDLSLDFSLKLEDREFNLSSINTGVPHAVVLVSDLEKINVEELGKAIRAHKDFAPAGTNVNFVTHKDKNDLVVRTYERGVEGETLACGTGAVASSLICAAKGLVESPVACLTKGGEVLKVYFVMGEDRRSASCSGIVFTKVELEGPAVVCFRGEVEI